MAKIREVFPRDQVAHLWANASQNGARNSSGNFFFTGASLYSYGRHFICAHRTEWKDAQGRAVYLVNADSYSNTTARHMSIARRAIPRYVAQFEVPGLNENLCGSRFSIAANVYAAMADVMRAELDKAATRRKSELRAWNIGRAYDAAELCAIIEANADTKTRRALARLKKTLPELPARDADFQAMKETRALVEQSRARESMETFARSFNSAFENCANFLNDAHADVWNVEDSARRLIETKAKILHAAKRGKIRAPKLPSDLKLSAMACAVGTKMRPRLIARAEQDAKRALYDCGGMFGASRNRSEYALRNIDSILESAQQFPESEILARMVSWIEPTLPELRRLNAQALAIDSGESVTREIEIADSYLPRNPRDAIRHYRGAMKSARDCLRSLELAGAQSSGMFADIADLAAFADSKAREISATLEAHDAARIEAWRAGASEYVRALGDGSPRLRVNPRNPEEIETSWGALVPVSVAPFIWEGVKECRVKCEDVSFGDNGPAVGSFKLRAINRDGSIIVGCHEIAGAELDYMARALGFDNGEAH